MVKARNIDYVMHFKEWELVNIIQKYADDKTETGKRLLKRAERLLDKPEEQL